MSRLRVIGWPSQGRTLSACRITPHPAYVTTQNEQNRRKREALGAEIARLRRTQGMETQADLAEAAGVGIRTISDIETGKKVPRIGTMRKIERALDLTPGATDEPDFLKSTPPTPPTFDRGRAAVDRLVAMSYGELIEEASLYDEADPGSGEAWLRRVMAIREKARATPTRQHSGRDARSANSRN